MSNDTMYEITESELMRVSRATGYLRVSAEFQGSDGLRKLATSHYNALDKLTKAILERKRY